MAKVQDGVNNETITYTYDLADRLVQIQNSNLFKTKYTYDNNSNVNSRKYLLNELEETINYKYDRDNRINYLSLSNAKDLFYHYDRLSRIVKKELRSGENTYITEYEYENTDTSNRTTTSIETVKNGTEELNYTYDAKGNIETISEGEVQTHKYYYDSLDQLIREDNKKLNKTITYTYDTGGNLLHKKEYAYTESNLGEETGTINYSYENTNWKDQLTSYNGKAITYDNIGNPLTYDGNTYTWQNGRQLTGISNTAKEQTITYKYNDEGIRTEKVVNGIASKYYLEGTKVIYEMTGTNLSYYQYDEQGNIIGMQYNGTQYYYIKNLQGDIIGILDNELNQVVKYDYDSWGKVIAITDATGTEITDQSHIGNINPYRYRSYRYDSETGLYYLQSRYYNPEWGRFINGDNYGGKVGNLLSHNIYIYCLNNPINMSDQTGQIAIALPWLIPAAMKIIMATVGFVGGLIVGEAILDVTKERDKAATKDKAEPITKRSSIIQYWKADNNAIPQEPLSYSQAQIRVASGKNIMCVDQIAALKIAIVYPTRKLEIDRDQNGNPKQGYYWHYHINGKHGAPHIWFYGIPFFDENAQF